MRVIFACAKTAGHINPAIAIANYLVSHHKGCEILFIGSKDGLENELVKKAGYKIVKIRTGKLIRKITMKNFKSLFNAFMGIHDSKKIIKEFKPDIIIGTGGYICLSVMFAAKDLKIPYIIHESNVYAGLTTKLVARHAKFVALGMEESKNALKNLNNLVVTGTPIKYSKKHIDSLNKEECRNYFGINKENLKSKKIVLVTGGSQGAMKINYSIIDMIIEYLPKNFYTILSVGDKNYLDVLGYLEKKLKDKSILLNEKINIDNYLKVEKYIFDMDRAYKAADICITRAGAMTLTELIHFKKPSILIPLPSAAENHQLYNAKVLEDINAAKILLNDELDGKKIYDTLIEMFKDDNVLKQMGENAYSKIKDDVLEKIYDLVLKSLK